MKIAMVIARYPPVAAGAEIQCQRLSAALAAQGHEVTVLTENRSSNLPYDETQQGVRVIRMTTWGNPPWSSFIFVLKLWRFLRKYHRLDLIHAHLIAMPAIFSLVWGRKHGIPVLIKTAGAGPTGDIATSMNLWRGRLKLWLFKRLVHSVVAPSGRARLELLDVGLKESQVHLIPNGVDFNRFRPVTEADRRQARRLLSLPDDAPIMIYAGRWVEGKNIELLLETWEKSVAHKSHSWKLLLVIGGKGVPQAVRERLNKIKDHVFVFENISDLLPYYHASNLAVLLSTGEGLSNFLLEAMACGLPTLTSESAAITTAPVRDQWSRVIPDAELSVSTVTRFFSETMPTPDVLAGMGVQARLHVENGFSLDAVARMYEAQYADCKRSALF